ncbi:PREDICTED: NADH dehydrogenase [ubiquinone] 1 alpha subcomplex assembly factor 5-like [Vollenhovia emeryi]|uniref:NADH dehydrogenase [ubiquinone] 1 alpha subcomplex assembly factor 5-like n=1 Tax=Vollenhovia emeryi TaxID=411798 RepID=UPI0005F381AC|nr:PREDICTED: NADH dehydrogenase [ubiquinone] 1 alpha subcomplex assembly factor 5-like [Vollenhovia emeryi]
MYRKIFLTLLEINVITTLTLGTSARSIIHLYTAAQYVSNNQLQRDKVTALIDEFSDYLQNISGTCMDIGCGPGDITNDIILPIVGRDAIVIGTDISKNMIEYARRTYTIKERLEFEVLDIQTKALPTKYVSKFDFIFSFHTLHWCIDIRQAFENIYRMLRPNGNMLILFVSSHEIFDILENLAEDVRFAPYINDVSKYTFPFQKSINPRKELKGLLQELGFTVNHCSHRDTYYTDETPKRFLSSILAFLDFIDDMPCNLQEEFKNEFERIHTETQINYKRKKDNKTVTLIMYKVLISFAKKYVP